MFLLNRVNCDFTVVLTGFATGAELSCERVADTATSINKPSQTVRFIVVLPVCGTPEAYLHTHLTNKLR
jgi:hypothetical protein